MIKTFNLALLALFVLFLIAPVVGFVFGDKSEKELSSAPTPFPNVMSLFLPSPEGRSNLAKAIFDRSTVKYEAISLRNNISYSALGSIETDDVISGDAGWLFYKPQFKRWSCANRARLENELGRAETILGMVEAANANVTFVVAPNKATIERGRLTGRASRYAPCYIDFERHFRGSLSKFSNRVLVDHTQALNSLGDEQQRFLRQDTHWTRTAGYAALAQLRDALPDVFPAPLPAIVDEEPRRRRTDLGNIMLRLMAEETIFQPVIGPGAPAGAGDGVLIIHDSFYGEIASQIRTLFPSATLATLNGQSPPDYEALLGYEHIVVQSIERSFLLRLNLKWITPSSISFDWGSPLGDHILDQSANAAELCDWANAVDILESDEADARPRGMEFTSATNVSASTDPRIMFRLPDIENRMVCIEAEFTHPEQTRTQLFFERTGREVGASMFAEPQSVFRTLQPGRSRFVIMAPRSALGHWARFDPVEGGDFELNSFQYAFGPGDPSPTGEN